MKKITQGCNEFSSDCRGGSTCSHFSLIAFTTHCSSFVRNLASFPLNTLISFARLTIEYRLAIHINNVRNPFNKLKKVIRLLASTVVDDDSVRHVNESILHQIIITEGSKTYLTKRVSQDNKDELFKPYKDLCAKIGDIILECNPKYKYPKSLSSTIIEMAHFQNYFMNNLPSLTDFGSSKDESKIVSFLEDLVFNSLKVR